MKALFITDPALLFQLSEIMKKSLITLVFNNIIHVYLRVNFKQNNFKKNLYLSHVDICLDVCKKKV